jgi:hypothetical protein
MQFTSQNAASMAAKAHEARRRNFLAAKEAKKDRPQDEQRGAAIAVESANIDAFSRQRLMRVRKQLDRLDNMIEAETDPAKLDRLASAQARLAEQERQLAGRPLPGSFRPAAPSRPTMFDRPKSASHTPAPPPNSSTPSDDRFEQE